MSQDANPSNPQVQMLKMYWKDASLQVPLGIKIFQHEWSPEVNLEMNTQSKPLTEANTHEVAVKVKCTVKCKDATAFVVEVEQAGVFMLTDLDEAATHHALGAFCPSLLYPFLREAVGDLIVRAGFPQLNLAPINFDAVYQQQLQGTEQEILQ